MTNSATAITGDTPIPLPSGKGAQVHYTVTPLTAGNPSGNVTVSVVQQALRFLQVDAGYRHTCGVKDDGTLACWGAGGDVNITCRPPAASTRLARA